VRSLQLILLFSSLVELRSKDYIFVDALSKNATGFGSSTYQVLENFAFDSYAMPLSDFRCTIAHYPGVTSQLGRL